MEIITSKEDLKAYVEEIGFLPLYQNVIPGFSVEELAVSGSFRSGDKRSDPLRWKRELSEDQDMAFAAFFDGREGYISREWFPVFAAYRRQSLALQQGDVCWDLLSQEIRDRGYTTRSSGRMLVEGSGAGPGLDRILKRLQAGTYLIQEYAKKEIHYIFPEQRWGRDYVCSCPNRKDEAWARITARLLQFHPNLTQRQLLKVLGAGNDRRAIVRQKDAYPDNFLRKLCQRENTYGKEAPNLRGEDSGRMDNLFRQMPDREQRVTLAEELLAEIRERERELILLRFKEQMTIAKICEKTGLSDEYVRKRIRNGIRRIQSLTQYSRDFNHERNAQGLSSL